MAKQAAPAVDPGIEKNLNSFLERFAELERRVKQLEGDRDAALATVAAPAPVVEARATSVPAAAGAPIASAPKPAAVAGPVAGTVAQPPPKEDISEETLIAISAAVAAFLGQRAHVRQVRLVSSPVWAQQGRVSIMASHRWAGRR